MDEQEQKLGRDLVKYVKDSKIEDATLKAKELVRLRAHRTRVHAMKGHMSGLAQQLQTVQSTTKIQETIAIDPALMEGLEVSLNAGPARRVRARDSKCDRDHCRACSKNWTNSSGATPVKSRTARAG